MWCPHLNQKCVLFSIRALKVAHHVRLGYWIIYFALHTFCSCVDRRALRSKYVSHMVGYGYQFALSLPACDVLDRFGQHFLNENVKFWARLKYHRNFVLKATAFLEQCQDSFFVRKC